MKEYEIIEKVGISTKSYSDAVHQAIKTVQKNQEVFWFEVVEFRGRVNNGNVEYQVIVKIGL